MEYDDTNREALKVANELRSYYHNSLWEEEKHYTWLVSIIFGAIMLVISKSDYEYTFGIILILSLVGYVFSRIALNVITAESKYFQIAFKRFVQIENSVFTGDEEDIPPREFTLISESSLWKKFVTGESLGIRSAFIFTFVFFKHLFLFIALLSVGITIWSTFIKC